MQRYLSPLLKEYLDSNTNKKYVNPIDCFLDCADACIGIKEDGGDNKGKMVEAFQATIGGVSGESWCLSFVQALIAYIEDRFNVSCDLPLTEHCLTLWNKTDKKYRFVRDPIPGDIVIWRYGETQLGHCGIVVKSFLRCLETIEGNTGAPNDIIRNGDGVYSKPRALRGTSTMHLIGFIRPAFNKL